MEDKNELSDIVLEKSSEKKSSPRKIILLVALLIVVFLIVLIVMKLLNKPTEDTKQALILPPAPTSTIAKEAKQEPLFEQVPIKKEEDNFEKVVKKLKEQEKEQNVQAPTPPKPPANKEVKKENTSTIEDIVKEIVPKVEKTKKEVIKKVISSTNSLYIQVGATLKQKPSDKFLKTIKEAGFNHTLYRVKVGDKTATKILIGPYKDRSEANKYMPTIKDKINKEAFLYRVKN